MAALMTRSIFSLSPSAAGPAAFVCALVAVRADGPATASNAATRSLRRATSWRSASRASATRVESTDSVLMQTSGSQRDQAVFLRGAAVALGLEIFQGLGQVLARVGRLDDLIDEPPPGRHVGRGERVAVRLDQLGPAGGLVRGLLHFLAENDLDRPLGPHDSDLGRRPGEDA